MPMSFRWITAPDLTLTIEVERETDGAMLDFTGAIASGLTLDVTACMFTTGTPAAPTASFPQTAAGSGQYRLKLTNTDPAAFTDGDYVATIRSGGLALLEIPDAMFGGTDATQPPNAISISPSDITSISDATSASVVTAINAGGLAVGLTTAERTALATRLLDTEQTGGGSIRGAIRAAAAAGAGHIVEPTDHLTTTIYDWADPVTIRITSVNTATTRTTTIH